MCSNFHTEHFVFPKKNRKFVSWALLLTRKKTLVMLLNSFLKHDISCRTLIKVAVVTPREERESFERLRRAVKCLVEIRGERVVSEVWSVAKSRVVYQARLTPAVWIGRYRRIVESLLLYHCEWSRFCVCWFWLKTASNLFRTKLLY